MKRLLFLFFFSFSLLALFAQPSLEKACNMFRLEDKLMKQQVEYKSPGEAGGGVLWDFSQQKLIDEAYELAYISDNNDTTIIGREHRTRYKYQLSGDSLFCIGYENPTTLMNYIRPELMLTYPFRYQSRSQDYFYGEGEYSKHLNLGVQGLATCSADGFGSMILPGGDTLSHVLRTHTVKRMVVNHQAKANGGQKDSIISITTDSIDYRLNADSIIYQVETYRWYADGYRYPVFETVQTAVNKHNIPVSYSNTAFYYTPEEQYYGLKNDSENTLRRDKMEDEKQKKKEEKKQKKNSDKGKATKDLSLAEKISYTYGPDSNGDVVFEYQLLTDCQVALSLYDAQGRLLDNIPSLAQQSGNYKQKLQPNKNHLKGTYLLQIVIDNEVIAERISHQ